MELNAEQEAAFNGMINRYYGKILKFCCYALGGDQSVAEDCTQDIFLILYENMSRLQDYEKIGGWLYKTAGNVSKQYAASRRTERAKIAPLESSGSGDWTPPGGLSAPVDHIIAGNIQTEEDRIAEEKAIELAAGVIKKSLKPKDEEILDLAFRQKQPLKDVAARLGISLSAAKSRASRLRQKICALARELLAE